MSSTARPAATLTPTEREWIRRQRRSARVLEAEQRHVREKLLAEQMRRRDQLADSTDRLPR